MSAHRVPQVCHVEHRPTRLTRPALDSGILDESRPREFFDSYARAPSFYNAAWRCFDPFRRIPQELQGANTDVCGDCCLYYLFHRCRGKTMTQIVRPFSHTDRVYNDTAVVERGGLYDENGRPNQLCRTKRLNLCKRKAIKRVGFFSGDRSNEKKMAMEEASPCYDPRLRVPGNMQIVGPSLSGKTTFFYDLVNDAPCYFRGDDGSPCCFPKIVCYYGSAWQPMFHQFQAMGVQFYEGLPDNVEALFPPETRPGLIIMDDLMHKSSKSPQVTQLLTKGTHHLDLFAIFLSQNLFQSGKEQAGQNRNYHYRSLQESCGHPLHQDTGQSLVGRFGGIFARV